ncbi:glycoside hydrolase [Leeuwenhoekiella marinoflava]|uniref:glycoside hydrolase n=1 Tax=Leeuwenhoekiella marinoflava TaxID=988 RepID=UPI0030012618
MKFKSVVSVFSIIIIIASTAFLLSWKSQPKSSQKEEPTSIELHLDSKKTFQLIDNFGASDAWSVQFVGSNWPLHKREKIADLLFSLENDESGSPKGIGLSLWRFNLGAGSAEQGEQSGIGDEWRRAESFLSDDGSYDWNKQQGQVWFANAAKNRGVKELLIFSNSPPVKFTRNNKAYTSNKNESNLNAEQVKDFAIYLADVAQGLENKGLKVDYISPVNEPQWDWADGGQEGTPFWNSEISSLVKELSRQLDEKNLDSIFIDIAETAQINYLVESGDKKGRGDVINSFFNKSSTNYVGNLNHVSPSVSAHSYFTTSPFAKMVEQREKVNSAIVKIPDLHFWMSEYCILGDNNGEINGNGRDLGMESALYMAQVIHSDLVVANASAWHWWTAISAYDYKDGLVYIDKNKNDGNFYESKMLWAFGNYSRFIRPGYQRVSLNGVNENKLNKDFVYSAYKSPDAKKTVLVFINATPESKEVNLNYEDSFKYSKIESYVTSEDSDLERRVLFINEQLEIPAKSVTTFVCTME